MSKPKSLIGSELDSQTKTIEISQIKNLFNATNFDLSLNESSNTLPSFLYGNLIDLLSIYKTLGLNIKNILLSRESILFHRLVSVGESIHTRTFLKDAYEQQASANPIGFIILESVGQVDKEIAFYCERIIAVRGGFDRGRQ